MVVPQTPLYTSQVLTEDKELWEDVKVRIVFTSESGHKMAVDHYLRFKAQTVSSNRRKWPVPWPRCAWTTTRWRSKTWIHPTTLCWRDARGPFLRELMAWRKLTEGMEMDQECVTVREKYCFLKNMVTWSRKKSSIKTRVATFSIHISIVVLYSFFVFLHSL